jgi:hypothetical protein
MVYNSTGKGGILLKATITKPKQNNGNTALIQSPDCKMKRFVQKLDVGDPIHIIN